MRLRKPPLGVVNHLKSLPAIHKSVITPGPKLKLEISAETVIFNTWHTQNNSIIFLYICNYPFPM